MSQKSWTTTIEDAGDGTGDGILTFPDWLIEEKGWKEGAVLNLQAKDGVLIITEKKDESI